MVPYGRIMPHHAFSSARLVATNSDPDEELEALGRRADAARPDVFRALRFAVELGRELDSSVRTARLWEILGTIAASDATVARALEPHLDALAILREAGIAPAALSSLGVDDTSTWGVFAAEGPGMTLEATQTSAGWSLSGDKPWCSLAGRLSHALVTATTPTGRRLFAVALSARGVEVLPDAWSARGLVSIPSGPVRFSAVPAQPIGAAGWYLERQGFAWGGIGVAAIWWGVATGLARTLDRSSRMRTADQIQLAHLGAVDIALATARHALAEAASAIDVGGMSRTEAAALAHRTRTIVANAADEVLRRCARAMGPAPLALDADHAGRVADLQLYVRQHHAERDEAALGSLLLDAAPQTW